MAVRLKPWIYIAIATAVLSACATRKETPIAREPAQLQNWQARGRIAVSGVDSGGSGSFTWAQSAQEADVQMRGPIGIGSVHLKLSDTNLRIQTGDGQEYVADAAQLELAARLGAEVPTRDLRYWLVGIAAPGAHEWQTTESSATLLQSNWRIDYERFAVTSGVRLPMKLTASNGPAKVCIVIDKWQLP